MEIILEHSGIDFFKKVWSGNLGREETGECVVPDVMPDISEIIDADGIVTIRSKEVDSGRMVVVCNVSASVLYRPEGETGARQLSLVIPVNIAADAPDTDEDCIPVANLSLGVIDARMLNPRKVLVRCEVFAELSCYKEDRLEVNSGVAGAGDVMANTNTSTVWPVTSVREKTFTVEDEFELPVSDEEFRELLKYRVNLSDEDVKMVGSKLIFKGTAKVQAVYAAGESRTPRMSTFNTEFSQIMDVGELSENAVTDVTIVPTGVYIDAQAKANRSVGLTAEIHAVAQAVSQDAKELQVLSDVYSNKNELEVTTKTLTLPGAAKVQSARDSVRAQLDTGEEAAGVNYLYTLDPFWENNAGAVNVHGVYSDKEGNLHGFSKKLNSDAAAPGTKPLKAKFQDVYAEPTVSGMDVKALVETSAAETEKTEITAVESVVQGESTAEKWTKRPSVMVICVAPGDSLWNLAKKYGSTPELIAATNALEADAVTEGQTILIPKAR